MFIGGQMNYSSPVVYNITIAMAFSNCRTLGGETAGTGGTNHFLALLSNTGPGIMRRKRGAAAIGAGTAFRNRSPGAVTITKKRLPMSFKALVTDNPITSSDTGTADDTPSWNTAQFKIAMLLSVTD